MVSFPKCRGQQTELHRRHIKLWRDLSKLLQSTVHRSKAYDTIKASTDVADPPSDGIVGFVRAVAPQFAKNNIRLNAICPGVVKTNLVQDWSGFPEDVFTPMVTILRIVTLLVDANQPLVDSGSVVVPQSSLSGLVIEISRDQFYLRDAPRFLDDQMTRVMGATEPELQRGRILKL